MKKMLSIFLCLCMIPYTVPIAKATTDNQVETIYYSGTITDGLTVTKDNAPIRSEPSSEAPIVLRAAKGAVLEKVKSVKSSTALWNLNKWYQISYNGLDYFIYEANVEKHNHSYQELYHDGTVFKICDCGSVVVEVTEECQVLYADAVLQLAMPAATSAMAADGPFPFGDLIAVGIVATSFLFASDLNSDEQTKMISEIISDKSFTDYLKQSEGTCNEYSFRRVMRVSGKLKYIDDRCLDMVEAYLYVKYLRGDVYTPYEDVALLLAAFDGSATMERDKDEQSYFFHYHLGTREMNNIGKGHIFFGTNDFGEVPT